MDDPFSPESELANLHTAFICGDYSSVLSDHPPEAFPTPSNRLAAQILHYRALCELGQYAAVTSAISAADAQSVPDLAAAKCYAEYLSHPSPAIVQDAERLAETHGSNFHVQILCGTVLARAGHTESALALLGRHEGSLDAVALIVQIHLQQNRTDLAAKEAAAARAFAQDALLVNLAESWIGMRKGGMAEYQKAFYVFEEVAAGGGKGWRGATAQAVCELHMGRLEEARAGLERITQEEGTGEVAWEDRWVLEAVCGRDEARKALEGKVEEKREAFRRAMGRYSPRFEP
ncbi:hypothetical protein M433DRAFT_397257 [Acidomyces richmondensis BFW]|nr:MAG: hypothetical protein FE78DRAFT_206537 [Acidomyces sp. 'richmondensis']KYG42667.1 hypothetical protein M433DRAFT_397257 [Acidomyces richmondensis BFW]